MKYMVLDFIAGSISSCVNTLVGYPFDFIKTRMQIYPSRQGALKQGISIVKTEGFKTLYRGTGMSVQMLGSIASGSIYFSVFEFVRRHFTVQNNLKADDYIPKYQSFIAGSCAGIASDIIAIPAEYMKILAQNQKGKHYQGPIHKLRQTIKEGGLAKLYKGFPLQMIRDGIGCGCFFLAQSYTLELFSQGQPRHKVPQIGILMSSIAAGFGYWVISYPMDIIKTRYQTSQMSVTDITRTIYNSGMLEFYKGFKITIVRSVIVNIFALHVYENVRRVEYKLFQ